jgi:hypothetical protein
LRIKSPNQTEPALREPLVRCADLEAPIAPVAFPPPPPTSLLIWVSYDVAISAALRLHSSVREQSRKPVLD